MHVLLKNSSILYPLSVLLKSTASWRMHVIYALRGAKKMLGSALSIEKYGIFNIIGD
jgi:hypothetical protein